MNLDSDLLNKFAQINLWCSVSVDGGAAMVVEHKDREEIGEKDRKNPKLHQLTQSKASKWTYGLLLFSPLTDLTTINLIFETDITINEHT